MPFIKLYALRENEQVGEDDFGQGNPARCQARRQFASREIYLNIDQIAAFEECPLYLICDAEPNGVVNGIRIRLSSGAMLVVPDDPEDDQPDFIATLSLAMRSGVAELPFSRYLRELTRLGHI